MCASRPERPFKASSLNVRRDFLVAGFLAALVMVPTIARRSSGSGRACIRDVGTGSGPAPKTVAPTATPTTVVAQPAPATPAKTTPATAPAAKPTATTAPKPAPAATAAKPVRATAVKTAPSATPPKTAAGRDRGEACHGRAHHLCCGREARDHRSRHSRHACAHRSDVRLRPSLLSACIRIPHPLRLPRSPSRSCRARTRPQWRAIRLRRRRWRRPSRPPCRARTI